ncbi:hypothetical protein [Undibacter mobilis]|uniref:Uncharacterized protein n=1 Tax=Undibacter mobilis TaxID=2292256 RepID=A0A371B4A2_9BRAD|nr:hypothetical protein [Undibacter mobilis]RDV02281.1 hypothetical protein DXH78_16980 [Undibacter mobilis]
MTTAIGSNPYGAAGAAYGSQTASTAATTTKTTDKTGDNTGSATSSTDTVDLSDAAKAYLSNQTTNAASLAATARKWFDAQYKTTGRSSPMLDGSVALDMTSISRETLSAIAANTDNLFSQDEVLAAGATLQKRFDDALAPHVVVARHTGDYAGLYKAAADYLDKAGADERATPLWISTRKAVDEGLALARQSPMKAPQTTNGNDPIAALLQKTSQVANASNATSDAAIVTDARARLDALANKARDAGTELVFDSTRKTGQFVDFTSFSNQSLALVTLNQDGKFSAEEARAAKAELSQRHRASLMTVFSGSSGSTDAGSQSLALISHYNKMSAAEKAASGYNSDLQNRLVQNYRLASMFNGGSSGSSGSKATSLVSYLK